MRNTITEPIISSSCPVCGGCGFTFEWQEVPEIYGRDEFDRPKEALFAIPCKQCKGNLERVANRNRDLSEIPVDYRDRFRNHFHWDLYGVDTSRKQKLVNNFIDNFQEWQSQGKGLYIFSKRKGTGKTFLASVLANELMALYGVRVKFVLVSDLLNQIKQADREMSVNPIATYSNTDVLILDDLGSQKGNSWLDDSLFQILDNRMHSNRVTIVTANISLDRLPHGERFVNRLYKSCIGMELPDVSIRSQQAEKENDRFLRKIGV